MKEAARCLLSTGPDFTGCRAGIQLQRVIDEYCCLHNVKALLDPRGHATLMSPVEIRADNATASSAAKPDYCAIGVRVLQSLP